MHPNSGWRYDAEALVFESNDQGVSVVHGSGCLGLLLSKTKLRLSLSSKEDKLGAGGLVYAVSRKFGDIDTDFQEM